MGTQKSGMPTRAWDSVTLAQNPKNGFKTVHVPKPLVELAKNMPIGYWEWQKQGQKATPAAK